MFQATLWLVFGISYLLGPDSWSIADEIRQVAPAGGSVLEANIQYLRVGLWETTAYALICVVTMTKSLYIADSFPAKKWVVVKALRDLRFTATERVLVAVSALLLVAAGYIEAYLIHSLG